MRLVQLLVFLILFTVPCQSQSNDNIARKQDDDTAKADFVNFWHQFRDAVINFDTTQIMKHTEFPFQTRGPLDYDPTIEYSRKKFVRVFKAFLGQWNGLDLEAGTELGLIKKTELPPKNAVHKDFARVGDLVFHRLNNTWKLVFAYLEYDTIDSLKK